ncbi:MAG: CO dehydrogenase/acetyl-CoA synthase subunit delta [Moorellales bacterium]
MAVEIVKDKNPSRVGEVVIGATKEEGGTRAYSLRVGGDPALPFHQFEGEMTNRPVLALEVQDIIPEWPSGLAEYYSDVWHDPAEWAKKCVEQYQADLVYLKLEGADPEKGDHSVDECVATVRKVLAAVGAPLIVVGCEVAEKDNQIMEAIAEAAAGERLLLGNAEPDNYRTIVAACMVHGHNVIAKSPLDINICKQLNILVTDMNLQPNRIVIDPSIGGLGYGIEYAFSIMERLRLGALQGDRMLAMPILCTVGQETWRHKEAVAPAEEYPEWGNETERGVMWEATAAAALLQAGAHILLMRHPRAVALTKALVAELMRPSEF